MPAYTFQCVQCGEVFERRLSFHDDLSAVSCPQGHLEVVRLYRPPAIVFKGSGFYVTDHGRGNGRNGNKGNSDSQQSKKAEQSKTPSEART